MNARPLLIALLLVPVAAPAIAGRQEALSAVNPRLEQLAAPVALFPDPVLALTLAAAQHPDEMDAIAAVSRHRSFYSCAVLADYVDKQTWPQGVKALLDFPGVVTLLASNPGWERDLGEAYIHDGPGLLRTVQSLRRMAVTAQTLVNESQQTVLQANGAISIEPTDLTQISIPLYYPWGMYGDTPPDSMFMLLPPTVLERGRIRNNAYCGLTHEEYAWAADNWDLDWTRDTVRFPLHPGSNQP